LYPLQVAQLSVLFAAMLLPGLLLLLAGAVDVLPGLL
jgi:hypothetical protein